MTLIIFNLCGLLLIGFIIWWFWLSTVGKATVSTNKQTIKIMVADGIYTPSVIHTKVDEQLSLEFLRKDPNPCAEKVIFAELNQSADLPVNKTYALSFIPKKTGEFEFTCQMGMYRGKLIVRN